MAKNLGFLFIYFVLSFNVSYAGNLDIKKMEIQPLPSHPKIEQKLLQIVNLHQEKSPTLYDFIKKYNITVDNDYVEVIVEATPDDINNIISKNKLKDYSAEIKRRSTHFILIKIPINRIRKMADEVEEIRSVRFPTEFIPLDFKGEGYYKTGGNVYNSQGYYGSGIKIAILDHGFIGMSNLQIAGELPSSITTWPPGENIEAITNHGTKVAEIIYDYAPQAQYYFFKVDNLEVDFPNAVDYCIANDIKIINFSQGTAYTNYFDGSGLVCNKVDEAYFNGILWVNAAGNHAKLHYEGIFHDSDGDGFHEFDYVADEGNSIYIKGDGQISIYLNWDAWPWTYEDYNLFVLDPLDNNRIIASSANPQWLWGGEPIEKIENINLTPERIYSIVVQKYSASKNHHFELYISDKSEFGIVDSLEYFVKESSLLSPADCIGSFAVAAINVNNWETGPQEDFSSQGPTNDGRLKPDICGPDNVSTLMYTNITGTSIAAPHVTGAAALIWEKNPSFNVDTVRYYLRNTAIDVGSLGPDYIYGYGRLNLDTSSPEGSVVINGNASYSNTTSVSLSLSASDPGTVSQMCISNTTSCSSWETYAATKAWTLPAGDGNKTVYAWFKDGAGNVNTTPYSDSIILDTTAPLNGNLSATPGNGQVSLSWSGFSDVVSGLASYKLVYSTGTTPTSCSSGTPLYTGSDTFYNHTGRTNGTTYYYRLCATDNAGNQSTGSTNSATPSSSCTDAFEPNDDPNSLSFFMTPGMNYGGKICSETDVDWFKLNITSPGAILLNLKVPSSNDDYELELYWPSPTNLVFSSGYGPGQDELIEFYTNDVGTYYVKVSGNMLSNGHRSYNTSTPYILTYNFTYYLYIPVGSGNGMVRVDGIPHSLPWTGNYAPGTSVQLEAVPGTGWGFSSWSGIGSTNPVTITVNSNTTITATFNQIDTTPPTGSISINGNDAYTKTTSATLALSASDTNGVSEMCLSNTNTCSSWETYATIKPWTLVSGDGTKTVYAWFKDVVGNANPTPYSDTIVLDGTAPIDGTLSATAGYGQVSLTWSGFTDATSGINSYKLVYSTIGTPSSCSAGTPIYTGPATSFNHSALTAGLTYYYRVCATDNANNTSTGVTASATPVAPPDATPPTPNPMTWATPPSAASATSISMVATTATDVGSPPVSYYFDFIDSPTGGTGGADSEWESSTSYTNAGLQPNCQYGYQVKARDSASTPNETSPSLPIVYTYTLANAPAVSSFSNITETGMRAHWTDNGNPSGTQYYCENTTNSTNSGWTADTSWDSSGLACGTSYSFRVKAKNGDAVDTGWTDLGTQATQACSIVPPVINPISDASIDEGTPYTGPPPSLSQGTLPVTWSLVTGPSEMSINSSTGVVAWTNPTASGSPHLITIQATNTAGSDTKSWQLTITPSAGVLSITPSDGLNSSGSEGGPFDPLSKDYVLENTGGVSINWTASKNQGWVQLSATGGSLAAGATTTVTVAINSTANSLAAATYYDAVTFTNTTNGNGNDTRGVALTISSPTQSRVLYITTTQNPIIMDVLDNNGLDVSISTAIPSDMSAYALVIVSAYAPCYVETANYLKNYVANGGGVILTDGTPAFLASPSQGGSTSNLSAIAAWFGAGMYSNVGTSTAHISYDHPFGTTLLQGTAVGLCEGDGGATILKDSLSAESDIIAEWDYNNNSIFSFTHTYGNGKVYYTAAQPYDEASTELFDGAIKWTRTTTAVVHCVSNAAGLQAALTAAESNGKDDIIKVVQGTYTGNFTYNSSEGKSITLQGGYTSGCASRIVNAANTVLDGGGSGQVLHLEDSNGGNILVDSFTIQNGSFSGFGGGVSVFSYSISYTAGKVTITNSIITGNTAEYAGGVNAESYSESGTAGNITLLNNTIQGNTAQSDAGGVNAESWSESGIGGTVTLLNNIITGNHGGKDRGGVNARSISHSGTAGTVLLCNNIITENSASSFYGGVWADSYSNSGTAGTVTLTNNTISGNYAYDIGGAFLSAVSADGGASDGTINCYNNIIWGNTATSSGDDIYLVKGTGFANGYNNDYAVMAGDSWDSSDGNIDADPLFVDPVNGDYHLRPGSPCINAGNAGAPELPTTDFEGVPRTIGSAPDIGADEFSVIPTDFDADRIPDILWRNPSTGANAIWYMDSDGTAIKSQAVVPSCSKSWKVGGVADFDGDGVPDILWRNPTTGANAIWYMQNDGKSIKSTGSVPSAGKSWKVGGVVDFDGDGVPDILWRKPSTGTNFLWYMQNDGKSIKSTGSVPSAGMSWEVGGVADFDGDGVPDILWRKPSTRANFPWRKPSTGTNFLWYMQNDGKSIKSTGSVPSAGTSWKVGKVADFDGDGVPDILWRNPSTGANALWYMDSDGTAIKSTGVVPSFSQSWDIGG